MGGGIFLVLKKKEAKHAWYRNLKMRWFLECSLLATTDPLPGLGLRVEFRGASLIIVGDWR